MIFFVEKFHPHMPLFPTNCNLLNILSFLNMKGMIYASVDEYNWKYKEGIIPLEKEAVNM